MSKTLPNLILNGKPLHDLRIREKSQKWVSFTWRSFSFGTVRAEPGQDCPKRWQLRVKLSDFWNFREFQDREIQDFSFKMSFGSISIWQTKYVDNLYMSLRVISRVYSGIKKRFDQIEKSGLSKKSRFWYWPKLCPFQTVDSFYSLVTSRTKKSPIFKDNKYSSKTITRNFSLKNY